MAQQERPNCKTCPGKDGLFEGKAFWLASDSWLWKIKSDVISEAPQALIVFSVWHSDTRPVRLSNISVSGCLYDFLIQSLSDCQTSQFLDACLTKKKVPALSDECNKPVHWLHFAFWLWFTFWLWDVHFALHSEADRSWFGGFGLCWFIPCSAVECASQQLSGQACPVFRVSRTQSD